MGAVTVSISMDDELAEAIRADARAAGVTVSSWLAAAAAWKLRNTAARRALEDYEREFGEITADEMKSLTAEWPV